jgi:hypothetical protein
VIESNSISSSIPAGIVADWLQQEINIFLSIADQLKLIFSTYPFHFDPPSNVSSSALVVFTHAWLLCCCFIELIENQLSPKCWIYMQIFLFYICLSTWICSTKVMSPITALLHFSYCFSDAVCDGLESLSKHVNQAMNIFGWVTISGSSLALLIRFKE